MNKYRTHNCGELTKTNKDQDIILSGWINKKRDHGNLLFVDLRDNYGLTQCVIDKSNQFFKELEKIQLESVVKINGKVVERSKETINPDLKTGEIEVNIISKFQETNLEKKKSNFEITYAAIIRIDENVKNEKEMEKIVLSDVPNEIYPRLEDLFISLVNKSGFPEVKIEKKVDFEKLYREKFN